MNLGKVEIGLVVAGMVGAMFISAITSSYMVGEKVQQIFSNTDRIIVLEDRDGKLIETLTQIKVDTAVNREKLKWIKESSGN